MTVKISHADVVKKNFERILDPKVAAPRAFLFEVISNIEVIDEYTVRLKLNIHSHHYSHTLIILLVQLSAQH